MRVMGQWSKWKRKGSRQLRYTTAENRARRQSESVSNKGCTDRVVLTSIQRKSGEGQNSRIWIPAGSIAAAGC